MVGKATRHPRPLERKRRRSNDSNQGSSQRSSRADEHNIAEAEIVVASSSQGRQRGRPKSKKPRTSTGSGSIDKIHQDGAGQDGASNAEVDEPSETPEKHVHFFEHHATEKGTTAAPGIIPGLSRTSLPPFPTRKATARRNDERASLPPTLNGSPVPIEELHFSPLRTIIDPRLRRRLRRSHLSEEVNNIEGERREEHRALRQAKEEIKELQLQLELQRQLSMDVGGEPEEKLRAREEELKQLKGNMQEMQDRLGHDLDSEDNDLDGFEDAPPSIGVDDAPTSPSCDQNADGGSHGSLTTTEYDVAEASTRISIYDPAWEKERRDLEQGHIDLSRQLSDAKSTIQILTIELSNLGFDNDNNSSNANAIIDSIRNAFHQARIEVDHLLTDRMSNPTSNKQFLILVQDTIRSLRNSQNEAGAKIEHLKEMEQLLKDQCDRLLDEMVAMGIREQMLQAQWHELDVSNETKEKRIVGLEDLVATLQDAVHEQKVLLQEKDNHIAPLQQEVQTKTRDHEKLRGALESYRDEVKKLESLIGRLEKEHAVQIAKMEADQKVQIDGLNQAYEEEKQHLSTAEADIYTKTAMITALELRLEEEGSRVDDLKTQYADATSQANLQRSQRETAEAENTAKEVFINGLQVQIADLESTLIETQEKLGKMKQNLETEHRQRERAESALDNANGKVANLEKEVNHRGVQANELRQKIFELQVSKDKAIKELEGEAIRLEQGLRQNLDNEIDHREDIERHLSQLEDELSRVKSELQNTEHDMATVLKEKDAIIQDQANEVTTLHANLDDTASRLDTVTTNLENLKNQNRKEVASLRADLHNANLDISSLTNHIQSLEHAAHESDASHAKALHTRDERLEALSHALATERATGAVLAADKASLERRVEAEAEAMLEAGNKAADEISTLQHALQARAADIETWQLRYGQLRDEYAAEVANQDAEITALKARVRARDEEIGVLREDRADLTARLVRAVRNSELVMARVQRDVDATRARTEQETVQLAGLRREILQGVDVVEFEAENAVVGAEDGEEKLPDVPNAVDHGPVVKKLKGSARKMMRDSGIGMETGMSSSP